MVYHVNYPLTHLPSLGTSNDSQLCAKKKQRAKVRRDVFSSPKESLQQTDMQRYKSSGSNPFQCRESGSGKWGLGRGDGLVSLDVAGRKGD